MIKQMMINIFFWKWKIGRKKIENLNQNEKGRKGFSKLFKDDVNLRLD